MNQVLCFNCFTKVVASDTTCTKCGVVLTGKQEGTLTKEVYDEPKIDYDAELAKITMSTMANQPKKKSKQKEMESDLKVIVILASALGLLQIYSAYLMDSINAIGPLFGAEKIVDGRVLLISGFIYFAGVILFYIHFELFRFIYLCLNLIHLTILFLMYDKLQIITFNLGSGDTSDLPVIVQDFLINIELFRAVILGFAICYVVQSVFMYKFELLTLSYNRYGR